MPKHTLERYQEIVDWHNTVVAAADRAQSRIDSSLFADSKVAREEKIAAVNEALTNALKDLMGGGDLDNDVKGKIATFSKEMVEKGVTSFKRVGEGEFLRKVKKFPSRILASVRLGSKDATLSDFLKHQYNEAKDKGIVPLSERPADVVPENSEVDLLSSRGQGSFELPPPIPYVERTTKVEEPAPEVLPSVAIRLAAEDAGRKAVRIPPPPLPVQSERRSSISSGFEDLPKNLPLPGIVQVPKGRKR